MLRASRLLLLLLSVPRSTLPGSLTLFSTPIPNFHFSILSSSSPPHPDDLRPIALDLPAVLTLLPAPSEFPRVPYHSFCGPATILSLCLCSTHAPLRSPPISQLSFGYDCSIRLSLFGYRSRSIHCYQLAIFRCNCRAVEISTSRRQFSCSSLRRARLVLELPNGEHVPFRQF